MFYDIAALSIQVALCVYCVLCKWRSKDDSMLVPVLLFLGLLLFISGTVVLMLNGSSFHSLSKVFEAFGFASILLGVHVHHARQLAEAQFRQVAAQKLRSVLPENPA